MKEILAEFLQDKISDQEFYDAIYDFIVDQNIRSGEYEGNIFIIKKLDRLNFIIFKEYFYRKNNHREISSAISLFRKDILIAINEHAHKSGFVVKGYGSESNEVITSW
ncbi:hypothetical protein [Tepidibacter hydrothermalis]|uniref:Uncharacterized protein n=1 Tax=Tepidibacter hydrothermalis TaxID=3036126 RepID=A0ABY8EG72_9FIRM|nr:hypothetical protein [Tepidibacter hydrothermalis]WFD11936.1 hypothetical protein P4S50_07630 [Tepidibacter hydrothermalis]